ncbi:MAG TPA: hypothetical protein VMG12_06580 [Polyangiaceae bacterium]|nr:hypothetical protein [Polyangiaceae bacterium]
MNIRLLNKLATYLGVLGAVAVPALVIAQQLPGANAFRAGELVRASDLEAMRALLGTSISRINTLQDRVDQLEQSRLTKDSVYTTAPVEVSLGAGVAASAVARCEDNNDIMTDCACAGSDNADLRIVSGTNESDPSVCTCRAQGISAGARVIAGASCIRVP